MQNIGRENQSKTGLIISYDSTRWTLKSSGERMIFPTDQIQKVNIKDHFKGFVGGLTIGLLAGLVVSLPAIIVHLNSGDSEAGNMAPAVYLIYGITSGALIGSGVGAAIGHRDEYIITPLKE